MSIALGRMRNIDQWFLWRLEWDSVDGKYQKKPCSLDGSGTIDSGKREAWVSYPVAVASLRQLHAVAPPGGALTYTLGFRLTSNLGLWFFDLDHALQGGQWCQAATQFAGMFPGAMMEVSSSGSGLHLIGSGLVPPHRTKPPKHLADRIAPLEIEFYHTDRGIAFGFNLHSATGSADSLHDVSALCAQWFPHEAVKDGSDQRRPEWRGPEDDDELIALFMRSNQSPLGMLAGKTTLQQLWRGEVEKDNAADMALAAHLAYWTGCDGDRMERLMRRSGLVRDKWDQHRTYLRELTIRNACNGCDRVYSAPEVTEVISAAPVSTTISMLLNDIAACGTYEAIYDDLIPKIRDHGLPRVHIERLAQAINKKLDFFDAKLPIGQLRTLLAPKATSVELAREVPEWLQKHCFVKKSETFYNVETGSESSIVAFNAEYSRCMPMRDNGRRELPATWAFERWDVMVVDDKLYHPRMDHYFEFGGLQYVNTYKGLPDYEQYSEAVVEQINRFNQHLFLLCGQRQDAYKILLQWLAHNVQHPGRKIKWSPLIKGVPGDGKSILADVLRAAMGINNIKITSTSVLANKGGFTDWAKGAAVNVIEEIRLTGPIRYELFEAMKNFIDLEHININAKGKVDYQIPNVTNHIALSNFNDALPIDLTDRRWMIVISPNSDIMDAVHDRGLSTTDELVAWFKGIGDACRAHPGQWRAWLESIDLSDFNPSARAPVTDERARMVASAKSEVDDLIEEILEQGGLGLSKDVFCSGILQSTLKTTAMMRGVEIPTSKAWHALLSRMGYERLERPMKFNGQTQKVWARSKFARNFEQVRLMLEGTRGP